MADVFPERQIARMPKIKNVGSTRMALNNFNPFNASWSKLQRFEGFSAIQV